ncbi:hypothetical protein M2459_002895 [Parabacteroides sp. PF5-5]|uniref:outer membrane beta-barrel protein n=1 Tax=unclassified Parabacteroides TaxID=2649774 RepID=UPI002476F667|nr:MULTISPECIES: outer membrane beta-barrel protein [unclassified Parabacteroides]MDH6306181.1 hypothetical protein [Parabacteroides sp. PH5-39]MDH6317140.1 hypothetical protein [Parabacteroides sp. PF5-13]MDH6320893.1 hypothetical protein [Parabacteroides sp. PH5-13]MDH6324624.1 hypothetical protein [Parabacteroides sp. PH5-8]MDH6328325.1 hypothetical protein [Parabacteroides sp. PH5-41]
MKNRIYRYFLMLAIAILFPTVCFAEKPTFKRHELATYFGYANMLAGTGGLTNTSNSYEKKLRSGISWDAQYYYNPIREVGLGILYSGFTSKASHATGSDHLFTHYIAPQFAGNLLNKERWRIRLNMGVGYIRYFNDSKVYGKERKVTGGRIAGNLGLRGEYLFTSHWGVSVVAQYILSSIRKVDIDYHGETIKVKFPSDNRLSLSRLNLSAGINYHF